MLRYLKRLKFDQVPSEVGQKRGKNKIERLTRKRERDEKTYDNQWQPDCFNGFVLMLFLPSDKT